MKYLFLSLCLLMSAHTFACMNKISPQDLQKVINSGDPSQAETLTYNGGDGVCFDGIDLKEAELIDNMIVDFIRKENAVSCIDEADCLAKEAAQVCTLGRVIRTESEVYCAVEVMKADGKKLVVSEEKKAAREAAAAIKAAQDAALASAMKAMDCGKSAQAAMLVRNSSKNLTTAQVKQIVAAYAPIKGLLDTGSLQSAVEEIQAIQADGVLVTESDKEAIIAHINQCRQ